MKKYPILIAATALSLIGFSSCFKDWVASEQLSEDAAFADNTYEDAQTISDQAYSGGLSTFKTDDAGSVLSGCASISFDTIGTNDSLIIDFGSVNCLCADGRNRRGKIIVTWTGAYRDAGTVITHTYQDYYVNDNHVEGSRVVTNMGTNTDGLIYFSVVVNGTITKSDGSVFTWSSSRTRTWVEGSSTATWADDAYTITGTGVATDADGNINSAEITTPLRIEAGCRHIVSGVLEITPAIGDLRVIDFGSGDCDDEATLTVGSHTRTIHLR